jgi:hypothetical protein
MLASFLRYQQSLDLHVGGPAIQQTTVAIPIVDYFFRYNWGGCLQVLRHSVQSHYVQGSEGNST